MIKKQNKLKIILIVCLFLTGCTNKTIDFPFELMVGIHDLPNSFVYTDSSFPKIDKGTSYKIKFKNSIGGVGALIMHQLTIYPDSKVASEEYPNWVNKWSNEKWEDTTELTFSPKNENDIYRLECIEVLINKKSEKSCQLIQLHNNLVILVLTNIQTDNMSFTEFNEILQFLDDRLPEGDIPMPEE